MNLFLAILGLFAVALVLVTMWELLVEEYARYEEEEEAGSVL